MPKKQSNKMGLFTPDNITTPEEVISGDKDKNRQAEFAKANERIKLIIADYFKKKRKPGSGSNNGGFTQQIIVDVNQAKLETKMNEQKSEVKEEKEIGD